MNQMLIDGLVGSAWKIGSPCKAGPLVKSRLKLFSCTSVELADARRIKCMIEIFIIFLFAA